MVNSDIENRFKLHELDDVKIFKISRLRMKVLELAYLIDEVCPDGREKSIAINGLDEVLMFANASIARHD